MWVKDGAVYKSHSAIRRAVRGKSLPAVLTDAIITENGFTSVTQTTKPTFDPVTEVAEYEVVNDAQVWTVRDKTAQEFTAMRAGMQVSMRQARLALLEQNLLSTVETAIGALDEPAKTQIGIEWEYAAVVDRTSPWMTTMASALGLTDAQMDGLFALAATK